LFQALIKKVAEVVGTNDLSSPSLKVVADHIRSCSFLIADGVLPSNEGRGYVLRRIIRRAIRHGNKLGAKDTFFYKIVAELVNQMGESYPQLIEKQSLIEKTIQKEEELFIKTIENGIKIFEAEVDNIIGDTISGEVAFKLYDTYGFPIDLTADMAREKSLKVDEKSFEAEMHKQKERSKQSGKFGVDYNMSLNTDNNTDFTGYSSLINDAKVLEIFIDGKSVENTLVDSDAVIVLDKTPFYAESGGQVGDKGLLEGVGFEFEVTDVQKSGNAFLHIGKIKKGILSVNDEITAKVDGLSRIDTASNHSATHLLHAALKQTIGKDAEQKGSLVDANKLRFDYSHDKPLSKQEIRSLERLVNVVIRANYLVETIETSPDKAKLMGAQALFGEKYGDIVRVVCMDDFSIELCGGTHVRQTGDIGLFKILSDSGIASGIRRIEAITGTQATKYIDKLEDLSIAVKDSLKANDTNFLDKVISLQELVKSQEKQIAKLKKDLLSGTNSSISEEEYNNITIATAVIDDCDMTTLRDKVDDYKSKKDKVIIVLATVVEDKVQYVIGVSKSITNLIKAGDIAKVVNTIIDGKGGGRPDMAQGGGNHSSAVNDGVSEAKKFILKMIG
jgi:alanyl-tRNA synthetase